MGQLIENNGIHRGRRVVVGIIGSVIFFLLCCFLPKIISWSSASFYGLAALVYLSGGQGYDTNNYC